MRPRGFTVRTPGGRGGVAVTDPRNEPKARREVRAVELPRQTNPQEQDRRVRIWLSVLLNDFSAPYPTTNDYPPGGDPDSGAVHRVPLGADLYVTHAAALTLPHPSPYLPVLYVDGRPWHPHNQAVGPGPGVYYGGEDWAASHDGELWWPMMGTDFHHPAELPDWLVVRSGQTVGLGLHRNHGHICEWRPGVSQARASLVGHYVPASDRENP